MPTENDKPTPEDKGPDLGAELKKLKEENKALKAEISNTKRENDALAQDLEAAKKKLKDAKSAPTGDCVFLGGKTYAIEKTVTARHATDEARKGYIDLDAELIVLKQG